MNILPDNIKPDKYLGKGVEFLVYALVLILIILCFSIVAIFHDDLNIGDLGAYLSGAIGSVIALLVAVFTFLAFYVQYDANKKIQQQFKVQQFESQFYKMLDIHIKNIEAFRIKNFFVHPITSELIRGETKGRRIFLPMIKEFHYLLEIVYSHYNHKLSGKNLVLNRIAYEIFFFGIKSSHLRGRSPDDLIHGKLIADLKSFQNLFRISQSAQRNIKVPNKKKEIKIKIRYIPFSGHESRLSHYFRHLYQTVKQIDEAVNNEVISYLDARRSLASLRAQLSNEEQQLLYYNYICGAGKTWDRLGGKHQFLTNYRMIHNIPLEDGRISEAIEHPRIHFKEYICNFCNEGDELFEWGDNRKKLCQVKVE